MIYILEFNLYSRLYFDKVNCYVTLAFKHLEFMSLDSDYDIYSTCKLIPKLHCCLLTLAPQNVYYSAF